MMRVGFSIACIWNIEIKELKFFRVFSNSTIRNRTLELQMVVQREIKKIYIFESERTMNRTIYKSDAIWRLPLLGPNTRYSEDRAVECFESPPASSLSVHWENRQRTVLRLCRDWQSCFHSAALAMTNCTRCNALPICSSIRDTSHM